MSRSRIPSVSIQTSVLGVGASPEGAGWREVVRAPSLHDVIHIENLGDDTDKVLDRKITFGCFPWRFQGGEAAMCRAIAFLE